MGHPNLRFDDSAWSASEGGSSRGGGSRPASSLGGGSRPASSIPGSRPGSSLGGSRVHSRPPSRPESSQNHRPGSSQRTERPLQGEAALAPPDVLQEEKSSMRI